MAGSVGENRVPPEVTSYFGLRSERIPLTTCLRGLSQAFLGNWEMAGEGKLGYRHGFYGRLVVRYPGISLGTGNKDAERL